MMNRGDIATAARNYMGQLGVSFVTSTILNNAINEGEARLNADSRYNRVTMTLMLHTGQREYTISTAALDVYEARRGTGSSGRKLTVTSRDELAAKDANWEAGTHGTSTHYYLDGAYLGVNPKPGGTALVYYRTLKDPRSMSSHASIPNWCPRRWHNTISKAAALEIVGGFDAENARADIRVSKLYNEYLSESKSLARMADGRSRERTGQIRPTGYACYRRR